MSQANWTLGLVVILLILFIAFAIFVIYYSLKAEAQAFATINKLQTEFDAANTKINTLTDQLTPILTVIQTDITIAKEVYKKYEFVIDAYLCTNYPPIAAALGITCPK